MFLRAIWGGGLRLDNVYPLVRADVQTSGDSVEFLAVEKIWNGDVVMFCRLVEVPRVLFLGICLDFYYFLRRVLLPKIGFHFDWGSVSQALVKPHLVPP